MTSKSDARKKLDKESFNPLGGNPPPDTSWGAIDGALYGGSGGDLNIPTIERRVATSVKLDDVVPDFAQPRRLIPVDIRANWRGEPHLVGDLLSRWHVASERALGRPINIEVMIDRATDGNEADAVMNPLAHNFLALVGLAGSIKRDGLENPVSVVGRTGRRKLVAGERRYWAYQLLRKWYGDKWDSIPATVVDKPNVWRQAAENGAREELNAISKARQLALLVMDMYVGDDGVSFNEIEFFDHEQEFYAQVADGNRYRIKSGMGERVLQVMGFRDPKYLYHIRNLLKIPRDLWDTADAENWTENRVRETLKPRETSTVVDVYTGDKKVNGDYTSTIVDVPAPENGTSLFKNSMLNWLENHVKDSKQQMGFMGRSEDTSIFIYWDRDNYQYEKRVGKSAFMGSIKSIDTFLIEMYQVQPNLGKWLMLTYPQWKDAVNHPSPDDRRQKQFSKFSELMGGQLPSLQIGFGMYTRIGAIYVGRKDATQYEILHARGGDLNKQVHGLEAVLKIMFERCPDYWTWKQMRIDEFKRTHAQDPSPLTLSPTPRPDWDVDKTRHDMGIGDEDDEELLALREQAVIDEEIANYKANNPPTSQPPKDFDNPLVFDKSSPEYLLAYAVMVAMERDGRDNAKHVANMLTKITGYEILNWHGNWADVVNSWHGVFSEALADLMNGMFNRLDEIGRKP